MQMACKHIGRLLPGVLAVLTAFCGPAAWAASDEVVFAERAGDVLQYGVPAVALGLALAMTRDDESDKPDLRWAEAGSAFRFEVARLTGDPLHDLLLSMGRTEAMTYGMKFSVDALRPNGGSHSFPSGHTASAFVGAEHIRKTYGWSWGAPAYLAAGFVGWSRVASANHWPRDVLAGALIGVLNNHDIDRVPSPFGIVSVRPGLIVGNDRGGGNSVADALASEARQPVLGFTVRIEF